MSLLLYGCTIWTLTKHLGKKARWKIHAFCFEQIREAVTHKATFVRPLTSHLTNYPRKAN